MAARWTFMVYMAGFNNLTDFATADLEEMRSVGSTDDVKIAVFIKRLGKTAATRLIVGRGGAGEQPEDIEEADSGTPQTLLDFVRWAAQTAPAERYALVVWNHGSGWDVLDLDEVYAEVRSRGGAAAEGMTSREIGMRATQRIGRALFKPTLETVFELPTQGERAIASDDGTGHSLDTIELKNVLEKAQAELGTLELLGMDACLMSTLEVAYEAQQYTRVVVGSEELEPGDGWPYQRIVGDLVAEPDMDGKELGRRIVRHYVDSYADQQSQWPVTQCAIAAEGIGGFAEQLDALATALQSELATPAGLAYVVRAHRRAPRFTGDLVDLRVFAETLAGSDVGDETKTAAQAVVEALTPDGYVLAEGHHGPEVDGVGGVTAYLPDPTTKVSQFYADLRFANERQWDEFIAEYQSA
ncbi:MAG: clostripain-related cysteine peptidase [Actinomycetota bacterium]|nr:clostripain-related cysteine peptidase [Actinomycetota bacterium]